MVYEKLKRFLLKFLSKKGNRVRLLSSMFVFMTLSALIHMLLPLIAGVTKGDAPDFRLRILLFHLKEFEYLDLWFYSEVIVILISLYVFIMGERQYVSDTVAVTDKIRIPVARGQGQHGSARFATETEIDAYFSHIDLKLTDFDAELADLYEQNRKEGEKLERITEDEISGGNNTNELGDFIEKESEVDDERLRELVSYVGDRLDIKYLLKSKLSFEDLKREELKDITFDENYARLTGEEFNEVMIALGKAQTPHRRKAVHDYMVMKRYESIEQLKEIRYAIEDGISAGHLLLFADNKYSREQLKEIRLAYKSERIANKKSIDMYMLNPDLSVGQMKEIRTALMEEVSNIDGFAHSEIPERLMNRLRNIGRQREEENTHKGSHKEKIKEVVLLEKGGLVLGKKNLSFGTERIYMVDEDRHSLIIGETGSGKTRSMVLQSIVSLGLAGENIVATDIKGELSEYTAKFLESVGYRVIYLDFKNPLKSTKFNFLSPVIDAVNEDKIDMAVELIWDITGQLVGETKGEPIWQNGEAAVIAGAIMAVVYDNRDKPWLQNFANVYHFLATMCKPVNIGKEQIMPINIYSEGLDDSHPAKGLFAIGEIAPSRTRGSFYTSALTTLKLFTSQRLADMTDKAEFSVVEFATKKMAVFIILPEDRGTYNKIAALYVGLQYQILSRMADRRGGRLKIRCNFLCDEFGNFPEIPNFLQMITVSRGKGVRFNFFLQDLSQLVMIYEKEGADIIYGNCTIWIYLGTSNKDTLEMLSAKLSTYTVGSYSVSSSIEVNRSANSSYSIQLSSRNLLQVDELGSFERPYSLVLSKMHPAIMKSDDFSKWQFVKLLNMGSKEWDTKLRYYRQKERRERMPVKIRYWDIYEKTMSKNNKTEGEYRYGH